MNRYRGMICGTAATLLLLSTSALSNDDSPGTQPSIAGAWQVEVTVRQDAADCSAAPLNPFPPNPFPALYTFQEGGTVSETGSRSPPARRSPGHGVWQRVGSRAFTTHVTFQLFDVNGFLSHIMDIRSDISLSQDGSAFTAVGRFRLTDISGNALPFCHTMEAVRIPQ